jgi:hypothetical protein
MRKEVENVDVKLDIVNFLNSTNAKEEEFCLLYYNKETKEVLGGLSTDYVHLISVLTDLEDLKDKERFRGFILNTAINIINQFKEEYLEDIKETLNNL